MTALISIAFGLVVLATSLTRPGLPKRAERQAQQDSFVFTWPHARGELGQYPLVSKGSELVLRAAPGRWSPPSATLRLPPGAVLSVSQHLQGTILPAAVHALRSGVAQAVPLSMIVHDGLRSWEMPDTARNRQVAYDSGSVFEYLQYVSVGACIARRARDVLAFEECPWLYDSLGFRVDPPHPTVEWWVQIAGNDGRPLGWLLVDDRVAVKTR